MKICQSYEGMSQLWNNVKIMKECHSYVGMSQLWRSHFITTIIRDILAKFAFFKLPIKIPIIWVICVPPSIDILSRVNINNGLVLITLMWRKQVAFYYLFKAVKITPSKYNTTSIDPRHFLSIIDDILDDWRWPEFFCQTLWCQTSFFIP